MNQKKQARTDSPPNQRRTSLDSKRGIFTSNQTQNLKPNVIPYLQQSLQGQNKYVTHIYPHRTNQSLSFINSSYTNGSTLQVPPIHQSYLHEPTTLTPTKVQFIYPQSTLSQHNIPAYSSSQHIIDPLLRNQQVQYIPIENNREKTQIRRTVVPVHITNEIPTKIVVNPLVAQTPQYQPYHGGNTHIEQSQNDQAYQILLKEYQKLYQRLSKQQLYNQDLQKQITRLKQQQQNTKVPTPKHIEPAIQIHRPEQKNINIRRKYGINMKQLHDKLFKIYKKVVDDVITRKKQESQQQMRGYFAAARKEIVVSSSQVVEHSMKVYRKS